MVEEQQNVEVPEEEESEEEELEEEYIEDDTEEIEPDQIIESVTVVKQPVTLEVETGAEVGAKGEVKPFIKAKITRHLELHAETSVEVYDILGQDFCELAEQVKIVIADMKKNLNKGKPEMQ